MCKIFPIVLSLERCDQIQNPVNGVDVHLKEIGWKRNRSNKVQPKRAARKDVVNVMQENLKVGLVRESKVMTKANMARKKDVS